MDPGAGRYVDGSGTFLRLVGTPTGITVDSVPAVRVTRLTESNWEQFAALRLRALTDAFGTADRQYLAEARFTPSDWRRRLRDHAQFVAMLGGRPVGMVAAYQESAEAVYIYSLWLEPEARGRGLARGLVAAAVDWARRCGARTASLRMAPDNAAARTVYESMGFTEVPTGGAKSEAVMRLTIR
jgi:GNAT superfamily N-acetyltransferase